MLLNQSLPFTRTEAIASGITVHELAGPRYKRLLHGVYVAEHVTVTTRLRALAALRIAPPGCWISHHTAGVLMGGWMPKTTDIHLTAPGDDTRSVRRGVNAHRARPGARPVRIAGLPVSSPADVILDLAASRVDLVELVVAGDSLVKSAGLDREILVHTADAWSGRGARLVRRAAGLIRAGVDSAPESRLRMLIVLAGLPEPVVNYIIRTADGQWQWRFDLCYPTLKLIIEYDGRQHAENASQWSKDIRRREELERLGWTLIIINAEALNGDALGVLLRIRTALSDRDCPNLRRSLDTSWQRHFLAGPLAA